MRLDGHVRAFGTADSDKPAIEAALREMAALLAASDPALSQELKTWAARVHRGALDGR
jgi:hypothetical protein